MTMRRLRSKVFSAWVTAAILAGASANDGLANEIEPNNTCQTAQDLGAIALPLNFQGGLLNPPDQPEVDFFRILAPASTLLQIQLRGSWSGGGTLPDPYLGVFDSSCNLIAVNDDWNGLDSRLRLETPADGMLVVGVSACCDYLFDQGGLGTYTLEFSAISVAGPVTGRLVDARTGEPVSRPGDPYVQLNFCPGGPDSCYWVNNQYPDSEGRFVFESTQWGEPLEVGEYQIYVYSYFYESAAFGTFSVGEAGLDVGDLPLQPLPLVNSISGRLADALDGRALSGAYPDYAYAYLEYCADDSDYCYHVGYAYPDEMGRVRFESSPYGYPILLAGTYRISAGADQYAWSMSERFSVAEGEVFDYGDVPVQPLPIQVFGGTTCVVPAKGGSCNFSVTLRNAVPERFVGEAWTTIYAHTGTTPYYSFFQVGKQGTVNPQPYKLNLKGGSRTTFDFKLDAYPSAPVGTVFCATAWVGKNPAPVLDVQGSRYLFCISKDAQGYRQMSEKEGRKKLQEVKELRPKP